jgi:hypothetical protein
MPSGIDTASLYHASSTKAGPSAYQRLWSEDLDSDEIQSTQFMKGSLIQNR